MIIRVFVFIAISACICPTFGIQTFRTVNVVLLYLLHISVKICNGSFVSFSDSFAVGIFFFDRAFQHIRFCYVFEYTTSATHLCAHMYHQLYCVPTDLYCFFKAKQHAIMHIKSTFFQATKFEFNKTARIHFCVSRYLIKQLNKHKAIIGG